MSTQFSSKIRTAFDIYIIEWMNLHSMNDLKTILTRQREHLLFVQRPGMTYVCIYSMTYVGIDPKDV